MLRERLTEEVKAAMKAKEAHRLGTLRLIMAAIKDKDISQRGEGKGAVDDQGILDLLQKMVKQRRDSIQAFEAGGRVDLAEKERSEIEIISAFMPAQLTDAELTAVCAATIGAIGASGPKDMGRVMAALKERYAGRMDFTKASAAVKQLLS
jgi:hypothetical protein